MTPRVLPRPPGVGWFRRCPSCKRAFALKRISAEKRGDTTVEKYRCRHCRHEVEHGDRLPRGVV